MADKYKVITLCGSAKFKKEFFAMQQKLALAGNIILLPVFLDKETEVANSKMQLLKDIHLKKIDMSDEIFVINKNGYIGSSTKSEIEYAVKSGKKVTYMEN